jgi:hypothetical protein
MGKVEGYNQREHPTKKEAKSTLEEKWETSIHCLTKIAYRISRD